MKQRRRLRSGDLLIGGCSNRDLNRCPILIISYGKYLRNTDYINCEFLTQDRVMKRFFVGRISQHKDHAEMFPSYTIVNDDYEIV